jgi:hypothetical protein
MLGRPVIPLKGLIISNGVTDYQYDALQLEVLTSFNLYPRWKLEEYNRMKCKVLWLWFYRRDMLP